MLLSWNRPDSLNNRPLFPRVQDQGATGLGFYWGLSPWLVDSHFLATSSPGLSRVPLSSCKDTTPVRLGFNYYTLNYPPKGPIAKYSYPGA